LTETVTSPTLTAQLQAFLSAFPSATWHQYEPVNRDNVYAGAQLAFGEPVETLYRFDQAEVVLSLDADFLSTFPGSVRYARDFASRRRVAGPEGGQINRLYAIETTPTVTGAMADHRLPLPARSIGSFARALAQAVGVSVTPGNRAVPDDWVTAIARDLQAYQGSSIVIAGDHQPPIVHALVHAINASLANVGQTVVYTDPVITDPANQTESLRELVTAMDAGQVELLLILGGNPVFNAPVDLNFGAALEKVNFRAHLGLYEDETSALCHWHLPESHYLEIWGDARAYDGSVTIMQPLIEPLYDSHSAYEVLAALLGETDLFGHGIVRGYWEGQSGAEDFDQFWQTALYQGVIADTALASKAVSLGSDFENQSPSQTAVEDLEISFRPDPSIWDGRFANNGWLQELSKPLTKLTWDNAALISPATAESFGLANNDLIGLRYDNRTVQAPVWITPGQAQNSVTVYLGYGRTRAGRVGTGAGFNAYALRTTDTPWFGAGLQIERTGQQYELATTQTHQTMEGRNLIRAGTVEQFQADPDFVQKMEHQGEDISLYPPFEYDGEAWGMTIDLNACLGCNACVVACQAENNIPVVGKDQVLKGREMHWLRLDRYYQGDLENPEVYHQPVLCMHCENAPCEVVCPVAATLHDQEGLNVMVYNRCIGTRYCSNNCPYKVRRFNFLQFTDLDTESLKFQRNPEVTVRSRGVMEKCTYCVQRISAARIQAKQEGRAIRDGEVVTACQAACPTQAIVFGNINDPASQVAQLKTSPLNYGLLTELNTRPRTTYLAKLRNPNPELTEGEIQ
jgi:molybdopterin-containing oxidoreductase family iron-sulfur binding subunit